MNLNAEIDLSDEVVNFLRVRQLTCRKIIQYNIVKGYYVLCVEKESNCFLLKYCKKTAESSFLAKLNMEADYYQENQHPAITTLIERGNNYFITDYINGLSLRIWFLNYINLLENDTLTDHFVTLIDKHLKSVTDFYSPQFTKSSNEKLGEISQYLMGRFAILCLGGPFTTKRGNSEYQCARIIQRMTRPLVKGIINRLINSTINSSVSLGQQRFHGDLHYNNIIIDSELNTSFIDFEDSQNKVCWLSELLYSLVLNLALFSEYKKHQDYIKTSYLKALESFGLRETEIGTLVDLLMLGTSINSRFQPYKSKLGLAIDLIEFMPRVLIYFIRGKGN